DQPLRWLQGVRLRPRRWPPRPGRLRHDGRQQVSPTASRSTGTRSTASRSTASRSTGTRSTGTRSTGTDARVDVRKTYKLYIGGKFPRSESGRSYEVVDGRGAFLANAAQGSRKDARDAVVAARGAFAGWAGATAYN